MSADQVLVATQRKYLDLLSQLEQTRAERDQALTLLRRIDAALFDWADWGQDVADLIESVQP